MLQLTPQSRIFLAVHPVDFRKGIDGLAALCRQSWKRSCGIGGFRGVTERVKRAKDVPSVSSDPGVARRPRLWRTQEPPQSRPGGQHGQLSEG